MAEITLNGFRREESYEESAFQLLYEKLLLPNAHTLTKEEKTRLLKWGLLFFNYKDDGVKRLGYRIIVRYSNIFADYLPLYDIAINAGFIPISKFIENKYFDHAQIDESFYKTFLSAYKETFRDGEKYLSAGQKDLIEFNSKEDRDTLIVAPTSYGKSEMMIAQVAASVGKRICILVPSKALLAQTKRRLLESPDIVTNARRIITHPEMYRAEDSEYIAVFTQERLLRLMHMAPALALDLLLIDEAHNILERGNRSSLLLQTLLISKYRNDNIKLKFYTPFIANPANVETPYAKYRVASRQIREFIKIERYFIYDTLNNGKLSLYDQFIDKCIDAGEFSFNEFEFISEHMASKNIVYLNKPRDVEEAAVKLCEFWKEEKLSSDAAQDFTAAHKAIADYLHPDYKLLNCLKKGVIYHHGKIPEIIRLYIEDLFSKHPNFPFIVTSSTLLEGVNIPAEKMFLLSTKRGRSQLTRSAFKNLTGRVCRFREIFSPVNGNLKMLEPEIYLINGQFMNKNANLPNFLSSRAKIQSIEKDSDDVENVLLKQEVKGEEVEELKNALEYIENVEPGTITSVNDNVDVRYVNSSIGKFCFKNNIHEFDIHRNEAILTTNLQKLGKIKIKDAQSLMETIYEVFLHNTEITHAEEFTRLKNSPARKFYSMIIEWKMKGSSYKEMISTFMSYWIKKLENAKTRADYLIYVGHSWGDVKLLEEDFVSQYLDLRQKNKPQRVNIAIIRIKEEQDFVEFTLMKFVEVLNDLELLEENFYDHVRYGSSDRKIICMLKNGLSIELAKCLLSGTYNAFLDFDLENNSIKIDPAVISVMKEREENDLLIFEIQFHVSELAKPNAFD